jgi:hypothetical protein
VQEEMYGYTSGPFFERFFYFKLAQRDSAEKTSNFGLNEPKICSERIAIVVTRGFQQLTLHF